MDTKLNQFHPVLIITVHFYNMYLSVSRHLLGLPSDSFPYEHFSIHSSSPLSEVHAQLLLIS